MNNHTFSLIIDFDSTFIQDETLDEIAKMSLQSHPQRENLVQQIIATTNAGMEGKISFDQSLSQRLALIHANRHHIEQTCNYLSRRISSSILKNRPWIQKHAHDIYIISGGFEECIFPISDTFHIPQSHIIANKFLFDDNGTITGCDTTRDLAQAQGKVKAMQKLLFPKPRYVLGDGMTDYEIKKYQQAEFFIAFTENIARENVIKSSDLQATDFNQVIQFLQREVDVNA